MTLCHQYQPLSTVNKTIFRIYSNSSTFNNYSLDCILTKRLVHLNLDYKLIQIHTHALSASPLSLDIDREKEDLHKDDGLTDGNSLQTVGTTTSDTILPARLRPEFLLILS